MEMKKAVILLSGGLDSATVLALARAQGYECYTLAFDYGQRHHGEVEAARRVASRLGSRRHIVMPLDLRQWGGSALTSDAIDVPDAGHGGAIPATYVPARNLIMLSLATAYAETLGAGDIFIGVNSVDYSGYPDCRPAFIAAFAEAARLGTKAADEGWKFEIHAPLQSWSKAQIIREGVKLGIDYSMTLSCYRGDEAGRACGSCDSCVLRRQGFKEAGVIDPTLYR